MKCSEVRWRLSQFLNASTASDEDELIRSHLESCPDCALRLVSNNRLETVDLGHFAPLKSDVTKKVISYYPASPSGMIMVRHLPWVFVSSAVFAVGVFLFVRQMLASASAGGLRAIGQVDQNGVKELLSFFATNPLASYISLAILATILCIALVLFVDRPGNLNRPGSSSR